MLRRKTNEVWTDKHWNVTRKRLVEGALVKKRLYDIGWSDEKKCRGCNKEEGTEKHRLYHCPCWRAVRNQIPEKLGKREQRANTSKKDWRWQRGITSYLLSQGQHCFGKKIGSDDLSDKSRRFGPAHQDGEQL